MNNEEVNMCVFLVWWVMVSELKPYPLPPPVRNLNYGVPYR